MKITKEELDHLLTILESLDYGSDLYKTLLKTINYINKRTKTMEKKIVGAKILLGAIMFVTCILCFLTSI